jgi:hypothetical protein
MSSFSFETVAAAVTQTTLSEAGHVLEAADALLAARADPEERRFALQRIRRLEVSMIFGMSLLIEPKPTDDGFSFPSHLLESARAAFPGRQELHELPPKGKTEQLASFASEFFKTCYPVLRNLSVAGLDSTLLREVYKLDKAANNSARQPESSRLWRSLFAGFEFDEPCNKDDATYLDLVKQAALDPLNVTASEIILPIHGVFARHSHAIRQTLAADMEFLDLVTVRISDKCLTLEHSGPEAARDFRALVSTVALLASVVAENPRSWARHVSETSDTLLVRLGHLASILRKDLNEDNGLSRALDMHIGILEYAVGLDSEQKDCLVEDGDYI